VRGFYRFFLHVAFPTPLVRFSERTGQPRNSLIFNIFFTIGLDAQSPNDVEKEREKGAISG
jgi:hypothetical protein